MLVTLTGSNVAQIINYTTVAANTWESVGALPTGLKQFRVKTRDMTSFDYAFSASPTAYMTANNGEITAVAAPATIYVRTSAASKVIEVEAWV